MYLAGTFFSELNIEEHNDFNNLFELMSWMGDRWRVVPWWRAGSDFRYLSAWVARDWVSQTQSRLIRYSGPKHLRFHPIQVVRRQVLYPFFQQNRASACSVPVLHQFYGYSRVLTVIGALTNPVRLPHVHLFCPRLRSVTERLQNSPRECYMQPPTLANITWPSFSFASKGHSQLVRLLTTTPVHLIIQYMLLSTTEPRL